MEEHYQNYKDSKSSEENSFPSIFDFDGDNSQILEEIEKIPAYFSHFKKENFIKLFLQSWSFRTVLFKDEQSDFYRVINLMMCWKQVNVSYGCSSH